MRLNLFLSIVLALVGCDDDASSSRTSPNGLAPMSSTIAIDKSSSFAPDADSDPPGTGSAWYPASDSPS